ncbi:MAG TPA: nucleotidyltransferase domain-containing protein, partial [Burkholderiaceae bacterium]|nr:nucleotidyltransferase domain-containing protein [Burkholderiaceae bacterium]
MSDLPVLGVAELRQHFKSGKQSLLEAFRAAEPTVAAASRLMRQLAGHVDRTLAMLWSQAGLPPGSALLAVGGYGRGELFPYSDIDVLLLLPEGLDAYQPGPLKSAIEGFITACWDVGLEIGSSVRTLEECVSEAAGDITIQTALLEARCLAGERGLFKRFEHRILEALDPRAFLRAKQLEAHQRHTKYDDTPYALEPNCKESPGGLRDLQVLIWVARAAGLGKTWPQLAAKGLITPFESRQLQRNEGVLKLIRARLHVVAGRREDRLVFDLQTALAESLGYKSTQHQRSSEVLMHR